MSCNIFIASDLKSHTCTRVASAGQRGCDASEPMISGYGLGSDPQPDLPLFGVSRGVVGHQQQSLVQIYVHTKRLSSVQYTYVIIAMLLTISNSIAPIASGEVSRLQHLHSIILRKTAPSSELTDCKVPYNYESIRDKGVHHFDQPHSTLWSCSTSITD